MTKNSLMLALCAATLSACVSQTQWTPTVDTYGSSRAQFVTRDQQECRQLAMQVSGSSTGQAARGALTGGLLGAAGGAAIGAAAGSAGRGAGIGGAAGGVGTGAGGGGEVNQAFQAAIAEGLRNRGPNGAHNVLG